MRPAIVVLCLLNAGCTIDAAQAARAQELCTGHGGFSYMKVSWVRNKTLVRCADGTYIEGATARNAP